MAARTQVALTKQLHTELAHKQWLARNLHGTKVQRASLVRILKLAHCTHTTNTQAQRKIDIDVVPKKKSAPLRMRSLCLLLIVRLECEVYTNNSKLSVIYSCECLCTAT